MANYRSGEFMGREHFWCTNCSFDTPREAEIVARPCPNAPGESQTSPEEDAPPAPSAPKAEWVAYAAAHGIEVEGKTRNQIIETVEVTQ